MAEILLIEPFYGGSHKQLIDTIYANVEKCVKFTLPAKKWHWRARTSALYFCETIPASDSYRVLFTSAVLNLAELVALRPDLARLKKVIYFHENQLVYPVRKQQDRDFQYGYNQILSCLVADEVVFNSHYNMTSFLDSMDSFLKLIPDHRPKGLAARIAAKSSVLYFPLALPPLPSTGADSSSLEGKPTSADWTSSSQTAEKGSDTLQDVGPCSDVQCGEVGVGSAGSCQGSLHQKTSLKAGVEVLGDSKDLGVSLKDLGHNRDSHSEVSGELKDPSLTVKDLGLDRDSHSGKTDRRLPDSGQDVKDQTDSSHPGTELPEGMVDDDSNWTGNTPASSQQTRSLQQREELPKDSEDGDLKTGARVPIQFPSADDQSECTETYSAVSKPDQKSNQHLDPSFEGTGLTSDQVFVQETVASSATKDAQKVVLGDRSAEIGLQKEKNLEISSVPSSLASPRGDPSTLHIVWPHRWEHDKDPESFFAALYSLQQEGLSFQVSVLGEQFTDVPGVFGEARERLGGHVAHWGYQPSKTAYLSVLASAHVVVSTALHEFFGVAMLEAVHAGCFPLCPKRLVYPEIFPKECLYNTQQQLIKKLRHFCQRPHLVQRQRPQIDLDRFSWRTLQASYKALLSA